MKFVEQYQNPYRDEKVHEACAVFGAMDKTGRPFSADLVVGAMASMHQRGAGLGAGFAVYGLYPDLEDLYAAHIMYLERNAIEDTEEFLRSRFRLVHQEELPTRKLRVLPDPPIFKRYFLDVEEARLGNGVKEDYIARQVSLINNDQAGSYVFSLAQDMGVFKGLGYPEDIAEFFCLENYCGYLWTAHSRFPTNTPGWWGGAHPFSIADLTVVHNGELSSYGINRRYLEQQGYQCKLKTDTEVIAYAVDLLTRRHGLPPLVAARVFAPPLWEEINLMPEEERHEATLLRQVYGSLLLNGPFAVIIAHHSEMIGLTDRLHLRPLVVGIEGKRIFISSEESAIRLVAPNLEKTFTPQAGEPVISRLEEREMVTGAIAC